MQRLFLLVAATLALAAAADSSAGAATAVGRSGDWQVFTHTGAEGQTCFATSAPRSSEPAAAKRDAVAAFISAWPKDGVKAEFSVKLGYPAKASAEASATIDGIAFRLTARGDRAFVLDAIEELKLIEAMKKGATLLVQAVSERGTVTRDIFSLAGLSQALQSLLGACG